MTSNSAIDTGTVTLFSSELALVAMFHLPTTRVRVKDGKGLRWDTTGKGAGQDDPGRNGRDWGHPQAREVEYRVALNSTIPTGTWIL